MLVTQEQSLSQCDSLFSDIRQYDTFLESIKTLAVFGCGKESKELDWWCSLTTRDETPVPLNIRCTGVGLVDSCITANQHSNARYLKHDIEIPFEKHHVYDVVWCHNVLQYLVNPFQTLCNWRTVVEKQGALIISVPQNIQVFGKKKLYDQTSHCMYNWTVVQLIHMLTMAGWESRGGYFKINPVTGWITALVYNSNEPVRDPKITSLYNLCDTGLLPVSAEQSIIKNGYLREQDLILEWIDRSLLAMCDI